MRKNLGISPEETEADQSSVRRLSPADSRYIFSIRVPRSKGDEQICSPLCLPSPLGGVSQNRLRALLHHCELRADTLPSSRPKKKKKQFRINKNVLFLFCLFFSFPSKPSGEEGQCNLHSEISSKQNGKTWAICCKCGKEVLKKKRKKTQTQFI